MSRCTRTVVSTDLMLDIATGVRMVVDFISGVYSLARLYVYQSILISTAAYFKEIEYLDPQHHLTINNVEILMNILFDSIVPLGPAISYNSMHPNY